MTIRSVRFAALLATGALLAACGTTKVVNTWHSESVEIEEPEKVAVFVAWPEELERLVIERDFAADLRKAGVNAVESSELPGMRGELNRESVEIALRNANADGVVIVFVMGGGGGEEYERADDGVDYVGAANDWYSPQYYDGHTVREGKGYVDKSTRIALETTYVDLRRIERVWSIVTQSKDIEYQDVADKLSKKVISQMKKSGQI